MHFFHKCFISNIKLSPVDSTFCNNTLWVSETIQFLKTLGMFMCIKKSNKNYSSHKVDQQNFHLENCLFVSNLFITHYESTSTVRDFRRHVLYNHTYNVHLFCTFCPLTPKVHLLLPLTVLLQLWRCLGKAQIKNSNTLDTHQRF